jgi:hypothetical protein
MEDIVNIIKDPKTLHSCLIYIGVWIKELCNLIQIHEVNYGIDINEQGMKCFNDYYFRIAFNDKLFRKIP